MFTKANFEELQTIYSPLTMAIKEQFGEIRPRIENTFNAIQASSDLSSDTLKGEARLAKGLKDKLTNIEISSTNAIQDSAQSYLVSTFLTGYPIFSATSSRENEDSAAQITALTSRDQVMFSWVAELSQALGDVTKCPFAAVEVLWEEKRGNNATIATSAELAEGTYTTAAPVTYSGNAINRLDPYNTYYDRSVDPMKVHEDGTFAGYVKRLNYIQMKKLMFDLDEVYTFKDNVSKIFTSSNSSDLYKKLTSVKDRTSSSTPKTMPLTQFFGSGKQGSNNTPSLGGYEVIKHYQRIIPADFGISPKLIPNSGAARVFCLVFVNGMLIYAKPIISGNNYLPTIFAQEKPGEVEKKNMIEYTIPIQDLSTGIITATLQSMRKSVGGGDVVYNSKYIDSSVFNNTSGVGRNIPLKNLGLMADVPIDRLYHQVQYNDTITPQFTSYMQLIKSLGEQVVGINQTTQGNLTKGNRTLHEFETVNNNSQSRLSLIALLLESRFFGPIKEILKLNYFLYASKEIVTIPGTDSKVEISPEQLITEAPEYQMTDGLLPSTKVKNTDAGMMGVQLMSQNQELLVEYDVGAMIVSILKQSGFTDLKDYKRSPDEQQRKLQQQQQLNANPDGSGPTQTS